MAAPAGQGSGDKSALEAAPAGAAVPQLLGPNAPAPARCSRSRTLLLLLTRFHALAVKMSWRSSLPELAVQAKVYHFLKKKKKKNPKKTRGKPPGRLDELGAAVLHVHIIKPLISVKILLLLIYRSEFGKH